ncbi:MAG: NfeD family protein [Propionibacterium sp.]|nr:NfeD family protein [Propionibacterium sp.]
MPTVPLETLPEWFGNHLWAMWTFAGLVLAGAEMLTLDLTLLMLSGGAFAGAITALILPGAFAVQAIVASAVALISLFILRPMMLERVRSAPGYRNSIEQLVGSHAIAKGPISHIAGEVLVNGDTWSARTVDSHTWIPDGAIVDVYEIDGTHLIVQAVDPDDRQLPPTA